MVELFDIEESDEMKTTEHNGNWVFDIYHKIKSEALQKLLRNCKSTFRYTIIEESFHVVVKIVVRLACKMHPFDVANVTLSNSNQQFSSNCIHSESA